MQFCETGPLTFHIVLRKLKILQIFLKMIYVKMLLMKPAMQQLRIEFQHFQAQPQLEDLRHLLIINSFTLKLLTIRTPFKFYSVVQKNSLAKSSRIPCT